MTIEFKYTDSFDASDVLEIADTKCEVQVVTTANGFEAVVEAFKSFARLAGYHYDTVDRLVLRPSDDQETPRQAGASAGEQMELFPDEHETGGI